MQRIFQLSNTTSTWKYSCMNTNNQKRVIQTRRHPVKTTSSKAVVTNKEWDVSIVSCDSSLCIKSCHRDLSRWPCDNSNSANSWKIDCSECKQNWHVDCLGLHSQTDKMINKLVNFMCPLCWVSLVPTFKDDRQMCYVCHKTRTLKEVNNEIELTMFEERLKNLHTVSSKLNDINLEKFLKQISIHPWTLRHACLAHSDQPGHTTTPSRIKIHWRRLMAELI